MPTEHKGHKMDKISVNDLLYHNKNQDHTPRVLYHYTTFESFLRIIDKGTLKLGSLSNMNDPYEFVDRHHGLIEDDDLSLAESADHLHKHTLAHQERSNMVRLASLAIDLNDGNLLHRGWNLWNMWTLYGHSHKEVCLIFDFKKLIKSFETHCESNGIRCYHKAITYTDDIEQYENMFWCTYDSFTDAEHIDHLFTKPNSYEKEQEYRLLIIDSTLKDSSTPAFVPVKSALCGMVAGFRFPYSHKLTDTMVSAINTLGYNLSWFYFNNQIDLYDQLQDYAHDKKLYSILSGPTED